MTRRFTAWCEGRSGEERQPRQLYAETGIPKPYLDPKEPAFLGLLVMISLHKSLNGRVFQGPGKP